jgi:hypothetical protein
MSHCVLVSIAIVAAARVAAAQHAAPPTANLTYSIEHPAGAPESLDVFSSQQLSIVEMLNRADAGHLRLLDALVVPEAWHQDTLRYSPFPLRYEWAASMPRVLVVDQPAQALTVSPRFAAAAPLAIFRKTDALM